MPRYFKLIAENRRARHDYHIVETITAGVVLSGTEVKSIRQGGVQLKDSYATIERGQVWLYNCHVAPYAQGGIYNVEPTRKRKLLLGTREIQKWAGRVSEKGLTLIPLKMFFSGDWAKVELGLARAKKLYDKREDMKKKTIAREISRAKGARV